MSTLLYSLLCSGKVYRSSEDDPSIEKVKGDKSKAFFAEEDRPEKEVVCTLRCPLRNQTGLCKHRRIIIIF